MIVKGINKMSTLLNFMADQKVRSFLRDIQKRYNETYPDDIISEEAFEASIDIFDHMYRSYVYLEENSEVGDAGAYIAHCLGTYLLLFNQLSDNTVELIPED